MQKITLSILGCGSALPTQKNFPSSQLLEMRDKQFLIDCGEGAQIRLRQMGLKTSCTSRSGENTSTSTELFLFRFTIQGCFSCY
jgi:ribonuclease BN (tRNA processing enzyme)